MRIAALMLLALSLGGCSDLYWLVFGPSDQKLADGCGVSIAELKQTRSTVKTLKPYQGRDLGRCTVMKDDGNGVFVYTIEEPSEAVK